MRGCEGGTAFNFLGSRLALEVEESGDDLRRLRLGRESGPGVMKRCLVVDCGRRALRRRTCHGFPPIRAWFSETHLQHA